MLFFRSEDAVRSWCQARGEELRPLVSLPQLWDLSVAWYSSRLDPDARRPGPEEIVQIFVSIGLEGPHWDPRAEPSREPSS